MLAAGANINLRGPNRLQSTALIEAVIYKHANIVHTLLENGALPDAKSLRSKRALIIATAGKSNVVITELLLQYGAKVNIIKGDKKPHCLRLSGRTKKPK
jgi:ankyrin repeat protein